MVGTSPPPEQLAVELMDNRHTPSNGFDAREQVDVGSQARRYDESALDGFEDEADEELYSFALKLFEARLARHNITREGERRLAA